MRDGHPSDNPAPRARPLFYLCISAVVHGTVVGLFWLTPPEHGVALDSFARREAAMRYVAARIEPGDLVGTSRQGGWAAGSERPSNEVRACCVGDWCCGSFVPSRFVWCGGVWPHPRSSRLREPRTYRSSRTRIVEVQTVGALSRETIRRTIRRHLSEVRFCHEVALDERRHLEGSVSTRFIIDPSGAVASSHLSFSSLGNSSVDSCIVGAVRRWSFPAPEDGGIVVASVSFSLDARD